MLTIESCQCYTIADGMMYAINYFSLLLCMLNDAVVGYCFKPTMLIYHVIVVTDACH